MEQTASNKWNGAANVLNNQLWTADKGWSFRLGVGWWGGVDNSLP